MLVLVRLLLREKLVRKNVCSVMRVGRWHKKYGLKGVGSWRDRVGGEGGGPERQVLRDICRHTQHTDGGSYLDCHRGCLSLRMMAEGDG